MKTINIENFCNINVMVYVLGLILKHAPACVCFCGCYYSSQAIAFIPLDTSATNETLRSSKASYTYTANPTLNAVNV